MVYKCKYNWNASETLTALSLVLRSPEHCMHLKTISILFILSLFSVQSKLTGRYDPRRKTQLLIPIGENQRPRLNTMRMMRARKLRSGKVKILRKENGWYLQLAKLMKRKNLFMENKWITDNTLYLLCSRLFWVL